MTDYAAESFQSVSRFSAVLLGLLGAYAVASLLAFVAYGVDKSAAKSGAWRIPESTLHLLALVGGWPGALLAQRVFRHKTRKRRFQVVFQVMVLANCILAVWLIVASLQGRP